MVCARGGNRRTTFHICPKCNKKKYYVRGSYPVELYCHCQNCQYSNFKQSEVDRLCEDEE